MCILRIKRRWAAHTRPTSSSPNTVNAASHPLYSENLRSEEERKTSDRVSIALVGMGQVCREVLFELDKLCYFLCKWLKGCAIGVVCSLGTIAIKHLLDALIRVGLSCKPGTNRAFEGCLMGQG